MANKGQEKRKRQAAVLALSVAAAFIVVPAVKSFAQEVFRPTVNVRDYGAVGNGIVNDTAAIQRANDAAAAQGGGVVWFPAGNYKGAGIRIDSNNEFTGEPGATLKHIDGHSGGHLISSRVLTKKGSIVEGSNQLVVSDARGFVPNAVVAVRGAGGASSVQASTLSLPLLIGGSTLSFNQKQWWSQKFNYLLVENEIVSYASYSGSTASGVKRGLFGTKAVNHGRGARVAQLNVLYATVSSIASNVITLDRVAVQGVTSSDVFVGSMNMAVRGLTLDGSRMATDSPNNPFPVNYELARGGVVEGCTIRNGDHGAVSLTRGTTESTVAGNTFLDNGQPSGRLGAGGWAFQAASNNTFANNTIGGDSFNGFFVDDRSQYSTEWDAPSDNNRVIGNRIEIPNKQYYNQGIFIAGGQGNLVEANEIRSSYIAVWIARSEQGLIPVATQGNVVRSNQVYGVDYGLYVSGSNNWFERNQLNNLPNPITDEGAGNQFIENLIETAPAA